MSKDETKPAAKAETEGGTVPVTWRGVSLRVPATQDDWPMAAGEAFEEGRNIAFVKALLGPKQWAKVESQVQILRDLGDLGDTILKALGFDPGE